MKHKHEYLEVPQNEILALYEYVLPKMSKLCKDNCMNNPTPEGSIWCKENNVDYGSGIAGVISYIKNLESTIKNLKELNRLEYDRYLDVVIKTGYHLK